MISNNLAFDRASHRRLDENGFLHVDDSHITKATVNPYYGREIPRWEELGLDPERIYYGLRDPEELEKSAPLWNGLPLQSTAPDMERYQALLKQHDGQHQKAAHEYFNEKLKGRHVKAQTDTGPIQATFTGGTWQEVKRDMNRDPLKAELIPHMPDVIATGTYKKNELHKERKDGSVAFHEYRKQIETSAGPKEVIVDVAERESQMPRHMVYNLTGEGSKNYTDRQKKTPAMDSGPFLRMSGGQDSEAASKNIIGTQCEVVNVRLAERSDPTLAGDQATVHTPNLIKGAIMRLKKWFRGANDASPEVEKEEVDLAQAIIDLHKVDPNTGEVVDITEDEDKAAEIRKLIGELSSKLEPEEIKQLTDALW